MITIIIKKIEFHGTKTSRFLINMLFFNLTANNKVNNLIKFKINL